jgi:hypothetical protein
LFEQLCLLRRVEFESEGHEFDLFEALARHWLFVLLLEHGVGDLRYLLHTLRALSECVEMLRQFVVRFEHEAPHWHVQLACHVQVDLARLTRGVGVVDHDTAPCTQLIARLLPALGLAQQRVLIDARIAGKVSLCNATNQSRCKRSQVSSGTYLGESGFA